MNMEQKNSQTISTTSQSHGSIMDFVCHYQFENGSSQFLYLDIDRDKKNGVFPDHFLSFSVDNFVQTLASSNGLILLSGYSIDQSCYYVFNPLTKQFTMIPKPCIQGQVVRVGLASNDKNQFEVVVIEATGSSKLINELEFHIFSSETNKWKKENHYINLTLPSLPEFEFNELCTFPIYSNGSIHWEIGGYLLVYQVQENNCELIELPNCFEDLSWQSTMTCRRLCESSGCVYYCYTDFDGFHIWELLKENENLWYYDFNKFRWKLVQSVMHDVFVSKHQKFCDTLFEWEPYKISPIAYSDRAQILYLQFPGAVVGYNFDTRNLDLICTYSYQGMNFNCCSFLSSTTSGIHKVHRGKDLLTNEEMKLNLPVDNTEEMFFYQ